MTATLRYDVGMQFAELLHSTCQNDDCLLCRLKAGQASRWAGVRRPRHQCYTFALKLPAQVNLALELLRECTRTRAKIRGLAPLAAKTLYSKLCRSLGLSEDHVGYAVDGGFTLHGSAQEVAFLEKLYAQLVDGRAVDGPVHGGKWPDLTDWLVYADWLEECDNISSHQRAMVIRAWTHPTKAAPVKYGVIRLQRNHLSP
jgi:uncharacterized protein (TIGR02996 family)